MERRRHYSGGPGPGLTEVDYVEALMATGPGPTLVDLVRRPGWMADALCREHPEVTWHPDLGQPTEPAKAVCRACPVRVQCLAYALRLDGAQDHGVWGGTSRVERRDARRRGLDAETMIAELG